jgi:hypothetical protein
VGSAADALVGLAVGALVVGRAVGAGDGEDDIAVRVGEWVTLSTTGAPNICACVGARVGAAEGAAEVDARATIEVRHKTNARNAHARGLAVTIGAPPLLPPPLMF